MKAASQSIGVFSSCRTALCAVTRLLVFAGAAAGFADEAPAPLFRETSFEELANITVSTVSRHDEKLFTTPAATSVLTRSAVHDSGALSLPEALREVPGLNVAQINAGAWAIGARGFQWEAANKLLVMIDGRSVYSPVTGGVRWEDNPVFLEDLDRVEVVRGPGSSVWGANAVNGVINVVSRTAFETLGSFVFGGFGNQLESVVGAREGFRLSEHAALRIFGEEQRLGANALPTGLSAGDSYRLGFGGIRLDANPDPADTLSLQAGWHHQESGYVRDIDTLENPPAYQVTSTTPETGSGDYASVSWRHEMGNGDTLTLKAYGDRSRRDRPQYQETVTTGDLDALYTSSPRGNHQLSAGLGYRIVDSAVDNAYWAFDPARERPELFSGFVLDDITLRPGRLKLSLGTKVEHQQSTGWNLQPSARLTWQPGDTVVVWASIGQAVRIPTLVELAARLDVRVYPPGVLDPVLPAVVRILGNPNLKAEKLTAWEGGVRWNSPTGWSLDLSGFAYDYRNYVLVTTGDVSVQAAPAALVLGEPYANGISGESYGGELALSWEPRPWWRLGASCNYVNIQLHTHMADPFGFEQDEGTTPDTGIGLNSDWRFGRWQVHCAGRYVDPVPYYAIPAYTELDARVGWRWNEHLEFSVVGRNLLDAQHPEYDSAVNRRLTELRRAVSFVCQWSY